jgi:hypothetical protein
MFEKRTAELRERIHQDYRRQVAVLNSVFEGFTASGGRLARSIAIHDDDAEMRERLDARGGLEFFVTVGLRDRRDAGTFEEHYARIVYIPETGVSFVSGDNTSPTLSGGSQTPKGRELLSRMHSLKGWDAHIDAHIEQFLGRLRSEQMENLEINVEADPGFMERRVILMKDGELTAVLSPDEAWETTPDQIPGR